MAETLLGAGDADLLSPLEPRAAVLLVTAPWCVLSQESPRRLAAGSSPGAILGAGVGAPSGSCPLVLAAGTS